MITQCVVSSSLVTRDRGWGVPMVAIAVGVAALLAASGTAHAQLNLNYVVDVGTRDFAFPVQADRDGVDVGVQRAKTWFEGVFSSSSASFNLPVEFNTTNLASTRTGKIRPQWSSVRNKLTSTSESPGEDAIYAALPVSNVPFVYLGTDSPTQPRLATVLRLTYPQAIQLGLIGIIPQPAEYGITLSADPAQWFFGRGKPAAGRVRFTNTLVHETMHAMGFICSGDDVLSAGESPTPTLLDVLRLKQGVVANPDALSTEVREVRSGQAANFITKINASEIANGAYPASTGADTFQMSHFKRLPMMLNVPYVPIGIMDPQAIGEDNGVNNPLIGQVRLPDLEVMDIVGWNLNPATASLLIGAAPVQLTPLPNQLVRNGCPLLTWSDSVSVGAYVINLYTLDPNVPGNGARPTEFDGITTTEFCPPVILAPGNYWWEAVSVPPNYFDGYSSGWRKFTIACTADFGGANQSMGPDGQITADDVIVFLGRFFAGDLMADLAGKNQSTIPDGFLSADDIIVFLSAFFAGC